MEKRIINNDKLNDSNQLQDIIINDPNIIGGSDNIPQSPKYDLPDFLIDTEDPTYEPGSPPPIAEGRGIEEGATLVKC